MKVKNLDIESQLAPVIQQHLYSLESLCRELPDCGKCLDLLSQLSSELEKSINFSSRMLEREAVDISSVTLEQHLQNPVHPAVRGLESELRKKGKNGNKHHHADITKIVADVAKKYQVTVNDLESMFRQMHGDITPHNWIKFYKQGSIEENIDSYIKSSFVIEMYETMKPGLGDKAWVAISKRLRAEGYPIEIVEAIINKAIHLVSK